MKRLSILAVFMLISVITFAQQALWGSQNIISPEIHPDNTVTFRFMAPKAIKVQAKESSCVEFKQRAYEIAKQYAHHSSTIVRQMSGSIMGYMGDNDVWDIFCNVMLKKRDLLTISHITMGIRRHCTGVANGNNHFFGGTMTDNQRMDILNSLRLVYQKSSNKSIKGMCLRTIEELENTKEVANKA